MKKTLLTVTAIVAVALSGCATKSISTFQPFQAKDLSSLVSSGHLKQKSNTVFIINDSSSSMGEVYTGAGFSGQTAPTKLSVAKELLHRMNKTIPNIPLSAGLRSFGYGPCTGWSYTKLNQAIQSYSSASFDSAINSLTCSSGGTPVASAFEAANADLASAPGNIAVILLSDGHNYDTSPVAAIETLKATHGDKVCVHTIWVGNEAQESGQGILQHLSDVSSCGSSTTADAIASDSGMASFVSNVFFDSVTPAPIASLDGDADNDGIRDSVDKCPNTPKGAAVNRDGCWAFHGVLFDYNKSTIKAGYEHLFRNAINVLKQNPGLTAEIQGHTDSRGSEAYNQKLSENRALAVKKHIVDNGISASRLTTIGFGESRPAASNDTAEGRAHNRRVEYRRTDM